MSKDKNMLRVWVDGVDSHSNNTVAYFPELVPNHVKKLSEADSANEFYIDDSKEGLEKFSCK